MPSTVASDLSNHSASDRAYLFDLNYLGLLTVSGEDAQSFLQGQLSNDINLLSPDRPHQLSAYCTPKGRILAVFDVLKTDRGYALIAPRAILAKVLPRLRMFVMRAAVNIEQADDTVLLGLYSAGQTSTDSLSALHNMGAHSYDHNTDPQRKFILIARDSLGESDTQTPEQQHSSENQWRYFNIIQCLAEVFEACYEAFIPQSVNLDLAGGVNFKKGCYPGQEIIARVKYRGKPKTRMLAVRAPLDKHVGINQPIFVEGRESSAGVVSNLAYLEDAMVMNITLPVSHLQQGGLYLDEAQQVELQRLPCPYAVLV